jgi:tetratricopeptide (TPR) repeat protein
VRKTLAYVAEDPGRWVGHLLWKLRLFCADWELGNNEEPRFLARRFSPFLRWLPVSTGMLLAFAVVGALVAGRGRWERFPLWGFALLYSASVVLFFVNARFRVPVLPVLAVYAAWSLVWMLDAARGGRRAAAVGALLLGLALTTASRALVPAAAVRNSESNGLLLLAQAEARGGDTERALELYGESLSAWPGNPVAREGLGALGRQMYEAGDRAGAERAFARWSEAEPRSFDARFSLARAQLELGRTAEALASFEGALEVPEPEDPRYLYEAYGRAVTLSEQLDSPERALALAERMLARFPGDPTATQVAERLRRRRGD